MAKITVTNKWLGELGFGGIAHEISRCPICGKMPLVGGEASCNLWTLQCCGYRFVSDESKDDCVRMWNQHVEARKELMGGSLLNKKAWHHTAKFTDLEGIEREVDMMNNYMAEAIKATTAHAESMEMLRRRRHNPVLEIKKVHFNNPATVILWTDGTKTIVRAQSGDEVYDPEKGMALAIAKKFLGNKGNYYNVFDKYLSELESGDPCPTKKDVKESKGEQLMIKDCSIGDEVIIRDGLISGCMGAIGLCGLVDVGKSNDGLLADNPGVNILLRTGRVWRVNPDCIVERIKKAPSRKKNKK